MPNSKARKAQRHAGDNKENHAEWDQEPDMDFLDDDDSRWHSQKKSGKRFHRRWTPKDGVKDD